MITNEDGLKIAKLIKVESSVNNNKFYHMLEKGDGTFVAEYGRVGNSSVQKRIYDMELWDKKYNEKLSKRKGYLDKTDLFVTEASSSPSSLSINNSNVRSFVDDIMGYANESIDRNYTVSAAQVTQKQVDEAQDAIDKIDKKIRKLKPGGKKKKLENINEILQHLYMVIPRKMKKVKDSLLYTDNDVDQGMIDWATNMIGAEQDTLDVMRGQVGAPITAEESFGLEIYNLAIEEVTPEEAKSIKKLLGSDKHRYIIAYKITNLSTQKKFDSGLKKVDSKKTKHLWHGSGNQNWWNIMKLGLMLRPAARVTAKMFGDGTYFADDARKSIGYTESYLAVYDVHVGDWLHVQGHDYWMRDLDNDLLLSKGKYNSLFSEGGYDGSNNEYIIYREEQSTIQYLVKIR